MTEDILELLAVGDVFLNRQTPEEAFRHVGERFDGADLRIGNLEASVADGHPSHFRSLHIRSPPNAVDGLVAAGFDAMSFANNHAMDWGPEALCETVDALETEGIGVAGAGANREAAERAVVRERNGVTVGVLAFEATHASMYFTMQADARRAGMNMLSVSGLFPEPHVAEQDLEKLDALVGAAAAEVDALVVLCHFGELVTRSLTVTQRAVARRAVDAGADAVVGAHPHVLQAVETYRGAPILYSLGHFVFDSIREFGLEYLEAVFPEVSDDTAVAGFSVGRDGIEEARIYPAFLDADGDPVLAGKGTDRFDAIATTLERLSEREGTTLERDGDGLRVPI